MAQQSQAVQESAKQKEEQSTHLDSMISCITERNQTRIHIEDSSINNLYGKADSMIKEFDTGITRCKKYNQAKIHRKYQIIINDLQAQIKRLQDNLKLEQDARSPTKKHVSDILEKLVQMRADNQALTKENQQLKEKTNVLEQELQTHTTALNKIQNQQSKGAIERLPPIGNSPSLVEGVKQFLKDKQHVRKITRSPVTKLEKFLNQLRPKMWNWSVGNLLEEIDKWTEGIKEKDGGQVDMWRIRSSIARKFSDYMDQPQQLIMPKASIRSEDALWSKLERKHHQSIKYSSVLGSRRSLNASFN